MATRRAARLALRVAGWLLTPLIVIVAAAIGAAIGLVVARLLPPTTGLVTAFAFGLAAAIVVLYLWIRLLLQRPAIRHVLDLMPDGLPDTPTTEHLMHPDAQ